MRSGLRDGNSEEEISIKRLIVQEGKRVEQRIKRGEENKKK